MWGGPLHLDSPREAELCVFYGFEFAIVHPEYADGFAGFSFYSWDPVLQGLDSGGFEGNGEGPDHGRVIVNQIHHVAIAIGRLYMWAGEVYIHAI